MYLSSIDEVNSVDIDDNSQIRQGTTSPITSNPSQSSPPSCPTLLVIDDNSNSDDTPLIISDIPINSMVSSAQIASSSPLSTLEPPQGISEQQRRRNSSIAKLLGGQPLTNQQYEEINQQILDDQSSQSVTNNSDNGTDTGIQRSRSSITRTLLMNPERNDNTLPTTTTTTKTKARPSSPEFSKDFEYLIRRELDIEHAPSTLNRNSSTPSIFQNLSSARNSPTHTQSPSQSKLKRKRVNPKQQPVSTPTINKSLNNPPFTIPDPFELDHPPSSLNSAPVSRSHHHQNDLYRFDISHPHSRHHHHHHQQNQQQQQQQQQQYSLPMNSSTPNSAPFIFHQINLNSPNYAQFKIHHDRVPTIPCSPASSLSSSSSSSSSTSSCNCCRYPATPELASSTSVSSLSPNPSSPSIIPHQTIAPSSRKTKAIHNRPDIYEIPMQRSYSATSNSSIASLSSPPLSSGHSIPLKKRLLHAYKNEQRPSSTL
ncbi:unnamed protein product [Rotaria sordida]|uniref:Uncharacterized protein n=1 Tax=Rotaria sordida TaxID=392033 RepID=A0A819NZY7_9BILA|nr:unnamed protein product [Rotaria sordida]CAF4004763.1 unnamed protein product [Rotaria sordida]